ncbi:hypothetical protein F8M41_014021 [Gigaspora margarita]|uniref:Uncharacterized protein n=1 Tax=Gigaspora margarita TaxID=4874 RepID=A0A8H4ENT2_GIGMA|nr:hypothetical protein F8M41_014021 [Gigaspora margarita]
MQPFVNLSTVFLLESSKALTLITILPSNEFSSLFSASNKMSTMTHLLLSTVAKKAMQKKKIYVETIGIVQKAINIAIKKDDLNVLKFLKTYILQNNCSLVENTTNAFASGHKTSILEKYPEPNIIIEKAQVSKPIKKACDLTIMCEFCGGRSHKKELHDYDKEKKNESEWVGSSSSESDIKMDTDE